MIGKKITTPGTVESLLWDLYNARKDKNYMKCDRLRDEIRDLGIFWDHWTYEKKILPAWRYSESKRNPETIVAPLPTLQYEPFLRVWYEGDSVFVTGNIREEKQFYPHTEIFYTFPDQRI